MSNDLRRAWTTPVLARLVDVTAALGGKTTFQLTEGTVVTTFGPNFQGPS